VNLLYGDLIGTKLRDLLGAIKGAATRGDKSGCAYKRCA